MIYHENFPSAI